MESMADRGRCRAIGLSDVTLHELLPIYESARIKPAVIPVEAHPYLPETELLEFCKEKNVVFLAFAIGSRNKARAARRSSHFGNCCTSWKDAGTDAVGLGGAVARLYLPRPRLRLASRRISTSPHFQKTHSTQLIGFRFDSGSMK